MSHSRAVMVVDVGHTCRGRSMTSSESTSPASSTSTLPVRTPIPGIWSAGHPAVRPWLLRASADGDHLNGYCAGRVAEVAGLRDAMTRQAPDADVVDHAGRLLHVMCRCAGMGPTLALYPHAGAVMTAHVRRVAQLGPSAERFFIAGMLARSLGSETQRDSVGPAERWAALRRAYLALLDREDWCETARAGLVAGDGQLEWLARVAADLELKGLELRGLDTGTP
ncbi:hypothetical protein [Streptomyces sp. NBC_00140]|uniref:hypothetical protein n=1 Tax=Streptomyces sp. NBC_00140 TaxID=2975664 RepID=UPI00225377FF|nr:hypothetical protein [Streptomyces sp. NBC_00140]MCX5330885.1 hypothetical protein [Streptomyces sp. NBC_00140]